MKENSKTYTTGDVAKICHISVRTVQFYDKEEVVSPSELSDGGRRIYTESDIADFRLVCLYKNLGFSLKEVKKIMGSEEKYTALQELLFTQRQKIENQIQTLAAAKERIAALQSQVDSKAMVTISSVEELDHMILKRKEHSKTDIMTYIFLACYVLILAVGFRLSVAVGGIYPYAMLGIAAILLLGLIYYHASVNAYLCPNCHKKFSIGFFQDMLTLNGGKNGKHLKCPYCKRRAWMSETFKDDDQITQ